jgi:hypothetical protein
MGLRGVILPTCAGLSELLMEVETMMLSCNVAVKVKGSFPRPGRKVG